MFRSKRESEMFDDVRSRVNEICQLILTGVAHVGPGVYRDGINLRSERRLVTMRELSGSRRMEEKINALADAMGYEFKEIPEKKQPAKLIAQKKKKPQVNR